LQNQQPQHELDGDQQRGREPEDEQNQFHCRLISFRMGESGAILGGFER
jgi:hypothetical protein